MSVISGTTEDTANLNLPPPPEEPQPTDCCGSGCTPCVFDIYDEEMKNWREECSRLSSGLGDSSAHKVSDDSKDTVLSTSVYQAFVLESVVRLTEDTCLYRFSIPGNKHLGLRVGQHIILR